MSKKAKICASIIKAQRVEPIVKSNRSEILINDASMEWKEPLLPIGSLREMVRNSNILPQCIMAYKDNICGFGIGIRYKSDDEETEDMKAEFVRAEAIVELLNLDRNTKEIFEDLVQCREEVGIGFIEVIRTLEGGVCQVEYIREPDTIKMTIKQELSIEITYFHNGEEIKRPKRFRKFKQEKNGKVVYFKEFGDPRVMNKRTGVYVAMEGAEESELVALEDQANEILDFPIGSDDYGCVRWIGQILNVDGSRRAESLNSNYFINGRHTPLAIVVSGGTLSDDSFAKLQEYMNGIRGESGQHSFLVLEAEEDGSKAAFEGDHQPKVELKDMASMLQKDELFQDYIDNGRKKTQSSFRLPDLYVGYTTDFNRATAQTAMEITEKQVFQPERTSLAWVVNHRLLNEYGFKYVEAYFKEPDITNPDDLFKLLNVANQAGGVTPNDARGVALTAMGRSAEPFQEEWSNIPLVVQNGMAEKEQLQGVIKKAEYHNEVEVVAVMREVSHLLKSMKVGD